MGLADFIHIIVGVGYPVASQRSRTLLPSKAVIFVAEVTAKGLRQRVSSTLWKGTPARSGGPLQVRNRSNRTREDSGALLMSSKVESLQSHTQGLSWRPVRGMKWMKGDVMTHWVFRGMHWLHKLFSPGL